MLLISYPIDALLPVGTQLREYEEVLGQRPVLGLRPWRWQLLWLLEPSRAFAGTWLLQEVFKAHAASAWPPAFWIALGSGILLQMWTKRRPLTAWAPAVFSAGMLLAVLPFLIATGAIALGVGGVLFLRTWSAFFLASSLGLALTAIPLSSRTECLMSAAVMALPLVVRVLFQCRLVAPSRW